MNQKIKIVFIAIMLVAAVFLSGCVDSNSVNESKSGSDQVTENDNNSKMMSVQEDIGTNEINENANIYSVNTTTNNTTSAYSLNTTNTTSSYTHYSSGGSSSKKSDSSSKETITVSAAASLTEAFTNIEKEFETENPDIDVVCNFGASGTLRTQIEGGAPVDVFASAAEDQMDTLASNGFVYNDTREDFTKNSLVMITQKGNVLGLTGMQDLTNPEVEKISIGNPDSVPAGKYAKEALTNAGLWDSVSNKTILAENVKQALVYVETGEAEAGFVFSTDASSAKSGSIEVVTSVPVTTPITYPIAVVSSTQHKEDSQLFIDFVTGEKGQPILEQYGFVTETQNGTNQITDMVGRELTVPEHIDSVIATSPPSTILVYMLAPDKLAGWNFVNSYDHTLMDDKYLNLPVIGGWYGTESGNYETMISLNPDIVIEGYNTQGDLNDTILPRQESFGSIPVVAVSGSTVYVLKSEPTIEFMGTLLDCEDQADKLIDFRNTVLTEINNTIKNIPEDQRVHVYYAEGPKGLATDPSGSQHSQVIDICGGINVANCTLTPGNGMTAVSMENVIAWNPEVILTPNPQFYNSVYSDPLWANIDAVANKRVYLAPQNPMCWIDRPQGAHLILGTVWTAKVLYPDQFSDMDLESLTSEFYSDFFHYDLTEEELNSLLYPETEA